MLFLNPWLLLTLTGVTIPVIVHLVRRQAAKPVEWGAMRFLMDTLSERRRRMEWEDLLLMAARCLLLALAALAVARPFVPPNSPTPWSFMMPAILLGIGLFGASFVLGTARKRLLIRAAALTLLCLAAGMMLMEHRLNLRRFESAGNRDVVLILDASTSMTRRSGKQTLFDDALDEARRIVKDAPRGTSFAVILGGPSPQPLSNTPLSHRADVLAQLDGLKTLGGTFRAHEALAMATLVLAEGERPNKNIIVLTDAQRHGWRFDDAGAWQSLEAAWKTLPSKPRLLLRTFPQAPSLRNAGIASVTTSRDLTGTDRPCLLRTEIANTGNQPVTPGELLVEIDGQQIAREPLGLLIPGQTQVIETRHRFTTPGTHVVTSHLSGHDDLAGDDRADHVVMVRKAVRVVLVDGNPAAGFFERAAGPMALALAPTAALLRGGQAGKDFLMDPVVVPAPDVTEETLAAADVVVLADVSRLPAAMAAAVAKRISNGSGLLVLAGPRADPAFYNAWNGADGPLLPVELGAEAADATGISPNPNTFRHAALAWAADERRSDLGSALIRRWRKATLRPDAGTLAAAFGNGNPFLATRGYERGRCAVATCAFDARAGNLPGRTSFVPLVHELVAWCAGGGINWNLDPAWNPSVILDSRAPATPPVPNKNPRARKLLGQADPATDAEKNSKPPVFNTTDPLGRTRKATLQTGRRGRELRIDGPAVPGLYQVDLPSDLHESITGVPGTTPVPVVVRGDIAESRVDALTDDDLAQLRARTDVILPQTPADILAVLSGRGFGREITRIVAITALLLLVLETALARWVSRSRRAGDDLHIEFGDAGVSPLEKGGWR